MRYPVLALVCAMAMRQEAGGQNRQAAVTSDQFQQSIQKFRKEEILSRLKSAQTIVIGDFEAPGGIKIRRVLRGDSKVGDYWNSLGLPEKPVLIYHAYVVGDIGGRASTLSSTGYYELDGNGGIPLSKGNASGISIEEVMEFLKITRLTGKERHLRPSRKVDLRWPC